MPGGNTITSALVAALVQQIERCIFWFGPSCDLAAPEYLKRSRLEEQGFRVNPQGHSATFPTMTGVKPHVLLRALALA